MGDIITYTLTLHNNGPSNTTDIQIMDELPEELVFLEQDGGDAFDPDTHTWQINILDNSSQAEIHISALVRRAGNIINTARIISSAVEDPDEENDSATAVIHIPFQKGDVNGDGVLNLADIIVILQEMSRIYSQEGTNKAADIDGDGRIGMAEAVYLLQLIGDIRQTGL